MPDWFYHPVYRPIVKRLFSPATAQRITLTAMRVQASNRYGQALFRWLAHAKPPASAAVEAFGLRFPSAIGLGPGIDIDGDAVDLWPALGLGFVQLGPVGASPMPRHPATEPLLLDDVTCVVSSDACAGASAHELAERLEHVHPEAPIGVALRGPQLCEAFEPLADRADFFTLPWSSRANPAAEEEARELRSRTQKPLIARLVVESWDDDLDGAIDRAAAAGLDGCVVVHGEGTPLREQGCLHGQQSQERVLTLIERSARRMGDRFVIIGSCGVLTPKDALAMLDRGARLVQLYEGLIYAGPGLPNRITQLQSTRPPPVLEPPVAVVPPRRAPLAELFGAAVTLMGLVVLALAARTQIPLALQGENHIGRALVEFIAHNRACLAGPLLGLGALALWISRGPLARQERWSWWTLALAGVAPALVLAANLHREKAYAFGTGLFTLLWLLALAGSYPLAAAVRERARAWTFSPAGLGRLWLSIWAIGGVLGGSLIWVVGSTKIFVPQDLHYLGCTPDGLSAALQPFVAQDRIAFGAVLSTIGLVCLPCIWFGTRPGSRGLFGVLLGVWLIGVSTAIGVHFIINYISFTHLLPFVAKDIAFLVGAALLYRPIFRADSRQQHFRDV